MSKGQKLRALVNERLTAAAEEIFELFERTIAEYEEEVHRFKQRNNTQQQLLDQVLEPRVLLHRTGVQIVSEKSLEKIKEEPEEEQLQEFTPVSVKSEDDEVKSSVLHQRPTEENREKTNGEDCGAEAGCSSDPLTHLHSDSEGHSSDHTDLSEDWTQEQTSLKRSSSLISNDSVKKNVKQYNCSVCGKSFLRKSHFLKHLLIHTGQKPYKCSICEKAFSEKGNLKVHLRTHTGEKPYSCSFCHKDFVQRGALKIHVRTHTGEKPYSCTVCRKDFVCSGSLHKHMRTHTGEKPYSCAVCKKDFVCSGSLHKHMRTHTGEKPYSCQHCNKRFLHKSYLVSHLRTHTGEKPYSCQHCNKSFLHKSYLVSHLRTHTGEKPFRCSVCNRCFSGKGALRQHQLRIHDGNMVVVQNVVSK